MNIYIDTAIIEILE